MDFIFKSWIFVFLSIFFFYETYSQTFQKTYGSVGDDKAQYVLQASDGGYLIAGYATRPGNQQPDAYLLKIDGKGTLIWQQTYGGEAKDVFMNVIEANDGGYVAIGETWSFGQGQQDLFVVKTDLDGKVMWCKTFGGAANDYAREIINISDGYIISGPQYSTGQGALDAYIIRLDNNGNIVYSKTLGTGKDDQIWIGLVENNIMYAGGASEGNGCYVTLDLQTCKVLSIKSYGGSGTEALYKLLPTIDNNFILSDHTWSSTGGSEMRQWTMKIKRDGTVIWSKVYGYQGDNFRGPVETTSDGGFVLTPWDFSNPTNTDGMLIKIDAFGQIQWANRFGGQGSDRLFWTIQTSDKGFISVGHTNSFGAGDDDIFVVKTDSLGVVKQCCSKPLAIESQDFAVPITPPSLVLGNFSQPQNWLLQVQTISPFIFDQCSSNLPQSIRQIKLCPNETFEINGISYTAPATVWDTISNTLHCDSLIEYQLLPKIFAFTTQSTSICPGSSITLNGVIYNQPGIYLDTIPAATGCDTVLNITIFTQGYIHATQSATICPGSSTIVNGITYNQPGIYLDTIPAVTGCDTVLTITIFNQGYIHATQSATICPGSSTIVNGITYNQPGIYLDTIPAATGCDTVLNITIFTQGYIHATQSATICPGSSTIVNGITYNQPGIYLDTIPAVTGCDTILTITIFTQGYIYATQSVTICPGSSTIVNGITYNQPGIYLDTIPAATGCDTILNITIFTQALIPSIQSATLCPGSSVTFGGVIYTQPGIFLDTIPSISGGCDTALSVTILSQSLVPLNKVVTICPGSSTIINGTTYSQPGIFFDTLVASIGCDTALIVTIIQNSDTLFILEEYSICVGDTLTTHGAQLTKAGAYAFQEPSLVSCVLIYQVELRLVALPVFDIDITPGGCNNKPIGIIEVQNPQLGWQAQLNGGNWSGAMAFNQLLAGRYVLSIRNAQGCERTDTVQVSEAPLYLLKIKIDTTFTECGMLTATASHTSQFPVHYQWSPNKGLNCADCPTVTLRLDHRQVFRLLAIDSAGCQASAEIAAPGGEVYRIYAPNVFSPNDDGNNDRFTLYGSRCARLIRQFSIHDRWGSQVFYKQNLTLGDESQGWDGYARSQLAIPGVFTWWAEVELLSGQRVMLKGSVTVLF